MAKPKREKVGLYKFLQMFPDEEAAEKFFEFVRWGENGRCCPHCGSTRTSEVSNPKLPPYRCKDCRKHFSVRIGSIMERSPIELHKWLTAIYMFSTSLEGTSSTKLASDLGIQQRSAWFLAHRIRKSMEQGNNIFTKPVEADEHRA